MRNVQKLIKIQMHSDDDDDASSDVDVDVNVSGSSAFKLNVKLIVSRRIVSFDSFLVVAIAFNRT